MYTFNGSQYPSVSTICGQLDKSSALIPWALNCYEAKMVELIESGTKPEDAIILAKKQYKEVSGEAKDIGSQVHDAIEQYVKHGQDLSGKLKDEVQNGFLAFLDWENENVSQWVESETKTVNEHIGYGGTLDIIYEDKNGNIVLGDFKVSKGIYDTNWLQLAAYKHSREMLFGEYEIFFERGETATFRYSLPEIFIDKCAIVRLDKVSGKFQHKERDSKKSKNDLKAFESMCSFYYHQKKRRLKNNLIVDTIWG